MNRSRATALLFALLAAILAAVVVQNRGMRPKPASAPPAEFSAARAFAAESEILGGDLPHPVGSAAHAAVRDRLAAHLRALGYDVAIQRAFACTAHVVCAPVENVIARTAGDARPDALLVAAHYDSVASGPGASDDGLGVATVVETARALRGERFRNPIVFLITDAEEVGLIGAEAFVADADLSKGVAAVINVEARGTNGASTMFETSGRNRWLIRALAHTLPRPATTSLFASIYDMLPNDTDLTVFKRAGLAGVNFANIGGVQRYHTRLDNLAHVSLPTLQQHGGHALASARALANADLRQTSDANAVWFDVLSFFILWWPQRWSLWMAIVALVILLIVVVLRFHDRAMPGGGATLGVLSFFLSVLLTFAIAIGASWLAGLRGRALYAAQPGPATAAMWLIGIGIPIAIARRFHEHAKFDGLYLGQAICWSVIGIVLTLVLPGASYLAVILAMTCALLGVVRATVGADKAVVSILTAGVAAVLFFPLAVTLYDALGRPSLPVIATVVALVTTTFAPMIATAPPLRRALGSAFIVTTIVFVTIANFVPPYTSDSPRHINLRYYQDGPPRWLADSVTPQMARAVNFEVVRPRMFEWLASPPAPYVAAAPPLGAPPPEFRVVSDEGGGGRRKLTLHIRSARNAARVGILFRTPALLSLRVNGVTPPPPSQRFRNFLAPQWHQASVRGASEALVEITLGRDAPIDAVISDTTYGLPPSGAALAGARDASLAVPVQDGDTTTVVRRLRI
ncbi:MAG: M20/M25/M40 family metallo-hydrolase [Acidobacteriota bacterium]